MINTRSGSVENRTSNTRLIEGHSFKREPRLMGIGEVNQKLAYTLRREGREIHADVGLSKGEIKTLVMESAIRNWKWNYVDSEGENAMNALGDACEVSFFQSWKFQWRHKPYKRGA